MSQNLSKKVPVILQLELNDGITKVEDADSYDFYIPAESTEDFVLKEF